MRITRRAAAPAWLGPVAVLLIAVSVACGSSPPRPVPPVPEPAAAPAPRSQPAGRVVPLPGHPEGLVRRAPPTASRSTPLAAGSG